MSGEIRETPDSPPDQDDTTAECALDRPYREDPGRVLRDREVCEIKPLPVRERCFDGIQFASLWSECG